MDPYESPQVDPYAPRDLASDDLLPPDPDGEQLTLLHGILYAASLGVAACLNEYVREAYQAGDFPFHWWPLAILIALQAAGLAAIVLVVWRRVERRRTFPAQFGHWLLLAIGVECLVSGIYPLIYSPFTASAERNEDGNIPLDLERRLRIVGSLLIALLAIIPALAMYYSRGEKLWQRYAPLLMLNTLWIGAQHCFAWEGSPSAIAVTNVVTFLSLLCFLIAAGRDIRHPAGKDQIHWIGLGVHCGLIFYARFVEYYWGPQ